MITRYSIEIGGVLAKCHVKNNSINTVDLYELCISNNWYSVIIDENKWYDIESDKVKAWCYITESIVLFRPKK